MESSEGIEKTLPNASEEFFMSVYALTTDSFTALATSDYEPSKRATHHEIEWFFATTFKSVATSPDRGTSVRLCGAVFDRLILGYWL